MTPGRGAGALGSAPAETSTIEGSTKKVVTRKVANKKASGVTRTATKATTKATTKSTTKATTKSTTKASQAKSADEVAPTRSTAKPPGKSAAKTPPAKTPPAELPTDTDAAADAADIENVVVNGSAPKVQATRPTVGPYADEATFLDDQRVLLEADRAVYEEQATDLKAEADSLAQEREPGDVQFDEESGEGGTVTVDRERDLALSAQARLVIGEIDDALARIDDKTYGACERCFQPIPKARLRALPYARLCVACKSGGLSRR